MQLNIAKEVAVLRRMTTKQLRARYAEVFGELTQANNKAWLVKRIAWRLQALAEGDLSERARQRATELANDADLRLSPPKSPRPATSECAATSSDGLAMSSRTPTKPDERLPQPGGVLRRLYKGQHLQVTVLQSGFAYGGQVFASLSAVAKAITGSHCNGFLFFRLSTTRGDQ